MNEVLNRSDFCSLCLDKRTGQGQITTSGFRVGTFNWYLLFTYVHRVIFYNSLWLDSNRVWINSWKAKIRSKCYVWSGKWLSMYCLNSLVWNRGLELGMTFRDLFWVSLLIIRQRVAGITGGFEAFPLI